MRKPPLHEPKHRKISAAAFRDRVVHHALCAIIEPRFERVFIPDSYANRIGKGTHRAIDRLQRLGMASDYGNLGIRKPQGTRSHPTPYLLSHPHR